MGRVLIIIVSFVHSKCEILLLIVVFLLSAFSQNLNSIFPKHPSCPHADKSCLNYVLGAFFRPLLLGWLGQAAIRTFTRPKKLARNPIPFIRENLLNPRAVYFGLFLGGFTAIYKGVNCALRWASNGADDWHGFVAGLAGKLILI